MANKLYKPLLIDSVKAVADLPKQRFIDFNGNICTEGIKAFGVSEVEIEKGQYAPVGVLGIFLIESEGNIAIGDAVTSNKNGKAIVAAESQAVNGYSLDTASTGEVIRIVRGI